jgi:hypothetical protein
MSFSRGKEKKGRAIEDIRLVYNEGSKSLQDRVRT